jgi:virulence-associated protein VapD
MKIILGIFIFCLILFLYLHIQFHVKTSNDLEMYEVDQCSKEKWEEICDLRQPALFDLENQSILETTNQSYLEKHYHAFEIKIRNVKDDDPMSELYMPLPLHAAMKLFSQDQQSVYLSENNSEFLQETGVIKNMSYQDEFLRPYMVSNCNYDIIMGSSNTCTPFRYEINYRNFFLLTQGSAQVKMAPPQSLRYLHPIYDYENFEFRSPVNPWSPQPKYRADFDKMKCLEFTLTPGKTLSIPAYWWYSIRMNSNKTSISCFRYRTYMNNIAILPYLFMHALQIQNVKRETHKKVTVDETRNQEMIYEQTESVNEVKQVSEIVNVTTGLEETIDIVGANSESTLLTETVLGSEILL